MQIIQIEQFGGIQVEYVLEDLGNGEYRSTPKTVWDELEAAKENGTIS